MKNCVPRNEVVVKLARPIRLREQAENLLRDRVNTVRADDVLHSITTNDLALRSVSITCQGVVDINSSALGVCEPSEVSGADQRGRHINICILHVPMICCTFIAREEKQLVPLDRPAEGAAELVVD